METGFSIICYSRTFFATFVLESKLVQQIMRWDMAVLRESPCYQEIVNEGIKKEILFTYLLA